MRSKRAGSRLTARAQGGAEGHAQFGADVELADRGVVAQAARAVGRRCPSRRGGQAAPRCSGLDRAQAARSMPASGPCLQMHVADRDGQRIDPGLARQSARPLPGRCPCDAAPPGIADKAHLRLRTDTPAAWASAATSAVRAMFSSSGRRGAVEHHRGEARVDAPRGSPPALSPWSRWATTGTDAPFGQVAEHRAQDRQRRMGAAAGPGLQDDRARLPPRPPRR